MSSNRYEVTRAAVEVSKIELTPEQVEIKNAHDLQSRFKWLGIGWIGVSFVHMYALMKLFKVEGFIEEASLFIMVLGIDLALLYLATYVAIQRRKKQPVGCFMWLGFTFALLVEWTFNIGALWGNRPDNSVIPTALSSAISIIFGTFVPLIIYVSSAIPSMLDRTIRSIRDEALWEAKRALQEELDQEAKVHELEMERLRREREIHLVTVRDVTENNPLESHKGLMDALPPPDESTQMERRGNGKSEISTSDVPAMVEALRAAGIRRLDKTADLRSIGGWSSNTSAGKARDALLAAGVLREDGRGGFIVDYTAVG